MNAYFGHGAGWDWDRCECKEPEWERILDLVICKKCHGRRFTGKTKAERAAEAVRERGHDQ